MNYATFKYYLERHLAGIIAILIGLALIFFVGTPTWFKDNAELLTMGLIKLGFWSSAFLLITKYGFPKFSVQDTIKNDPIAISILAGCIAIAIALIL